ncbi:hypothetical protein HOY82DRAFT_558560, partial [Tuber indicum]
MDVLTSANTVLRLDKKIDVGCSINSAAGYGQIEGVFVLGRGFFTAEETRR